MDDDMLFQSCADATSSGHAPESERILIPEREPFLNFDLNSELSFEDKSAIYNSLVTLVKDEYPFDDALQDRAVRFLKSIEPKPGPFTLATRLITDLVPSSPKPFSGFVESVLALFSSPHKIVVAAALSFLLDTLIMSSRQINLDLVESDLLANVFATVQPHTLPHSENKALIKKLVWIIEYTLNVASPSHLRDLGITAAVDQSDLYEMIFQKVVLPSSQFFIFLISNRLFLNEDLSASSMCLLGAFIRICPFHRPTLEYVFASPIAMAFTSCLSIIEDSTLLWITLFNNHDSQKEWKNEGPEVVQSAKRMIQALISEGFEDALEQRLMNDKNGSYGDGIVDIGHSISQKLGSNVEFTEK
ncbi:hypothetical protein BLNAU_5016 [Blattamonas nauphoetae]|uniref:Uncharacterized protein n=1 Tax=Blattamonas nauphoetae TaxID=2049346 RepID=A0ABQ9Y8P0_9EUKA|nr:hypothetical protein BLNAU_5016 [Blattamonas nauphoetae]